jgi:uncharacterized protein YcfJ
MVQHRKFMDLALDDDGLHTPDGTFKLSSMTRAEVVRHRSRDTGPPVSESSPKGVVGGALVGGVVFGVVGAVAGGLLGSTIKRERPQSDVPRTVSGTLVFESPELAYSKTVGRAQVSDADEFVAAVKAAARLG